MYHIIMKSLELLLCISASCSLYKLLSKNTGIQQNLGTVGVEKSTQYRNSCCYNCFIVHLLFEQIVQSF